MFDRRMNDLKKIFVLSVVIHLMGLVLCFGVFQQNSANLIEKGRVLFVNIVAERLTNEKSPVGKSNFRKTPPAKKSNSSILAAKKEPAPIVKQIQKGKPEEKVDSLDREVEAPGKEITALAPPGKDRLAESYMEEVPEFDITDIILARIEKAKVYPQSARQRGLEGTSTVKFRIEQGGGVKEVGLVKSSGYSILDKASIKTIEKDTPFPYVDYVLKVALSFRLT